MMFQASATSNFLAVLTSIEVGVPLTAYCSSQSENTASAETDKQTGQRRQAI